MKILVIQLTRLGDILCTLPTLSAMRREYPDSQIHFLVRKSFSEAAAMSRSVNHFWHLDAEKILSPIVMGAGGKDGALNAMSALITQLRNEKFDKIINLSFSPSSSYLTHLISEGKIPVLGYTRTSDFFLSIPDEASRYFRAQVGIGKENRIHVMDLLAWVSGMRLQIQDLTLFADNDWEKRRLGLVCHLGASDTRKAWPVEYWMILVRRLAQELCQDIILVGGKKEQELGRKIETEFESLTAEDPKKTGSLKNMVGKTSVGELAHILGRSRLFIGVDSGPLHVASLSRCPSLNLSVGNVRFWETGPTYPGSRVVVKNDPRFLTPDFVFEEAASMLAGESETESILTTEMEDMVRYRPAVQKNEGGQNQDFWEVVKWLYFQGFKPDVDHGVARALDQCREACEIALQQTESLFRDPKKVEIPGILDRLDQVIGLIGHRVPALKPLIDDFFCEKSNIPPGSREEIFYQTDVCYRTLVTICQSLGTPSHQTQKGISP